MPVREHGASSHSARGAGRQSRWVSACRGAALVEFATAAPFILMLFAVVIDGGFYMYRHLRVRHITNQVARELATSAAVRLITERPAQCDPPSNPSAMQDCCTIVRGYSCDATRGVYSSSSDALQRGITFSVNEIVPNRWGGIPVIKVQGSLTSSCLICGLFAGTYQINATSVIGFESEGYNLNCSFSGGC